MALSDQRHLPRLHAGVGLQADDVGAGGHGAALGVASVPDDSMQAGSETAGSQYGYKVAIQVVDTYLPALVPCERKRDRGLRIKGVRMRVM